MFPHDAKIPALFQSAHLGQFPELPLGRSCRPDQLYIFGPNGIGKSHLAAAIANADWWEGGFRMWIDPKALLVALRSAQRFEYEVSPEWIHSEIANNKGVVILDDIFSATKDNQCLAAILHVVDARLLRRQPLIVTADKDPREVADLDSSIASRLSGMYPVKMQGPDRRLMNKVLLIDTAQGTAEEINL